MVIWTLKARRRLRSLLARWLSKIGENRSVPEAADEPEAPNSPPPSNPAPPNNPAPPSNPAPPKNPANGMEARLDELAGVLTKVFGEACHIIVQDVLLGYRRHQNLFILLIEVCGGDRPGSHVVKIGPASRLQRELAAWESCRPEGLQHDIVLLPLECGYCAPGEAPDRWMALLYGAAHQLIGVEMITTFEDAALTSVVHGWPQLESIGVVLWELYERLGHLLYFVQFEYDPAAESTPGGASRYVLEIGHLEENLREWSEPPLNQIQRIVNVALQNRTGAGRYINPVDYLQSVVLKSVAWRDDGGVVRLPAAGDYPCPAALVPGMMRGCAHGDLHGRNILVGQVRGRVLWPTVFDYEDMGPCNWIGWDFVKMETELKVRIYHRLFRGPLSRRHDDSEVERHFVESVADFEMELAAETERCHRNNSWPAVAESATPEQRLKALLLEIRHRAAIHLGVNFGRPNRWLEEYYFLLGCYGVSVARYGNVLEKESAAALISAGCAFARLSWPRSFSSGP